MLKLLKNVEILWLFLEDISTNGIEEQTILTFHAYEDMKILTMLLFYLLENILREERGYQCSIHLG